LTLAAPLDAVKEGDRVIAQPGDKVADGTRVMPLTLEIRGAK
jgi:hypothetical protein